LGDEIPKFQDALIMIDLSFLIEKYRSEKSPWSKFKIAKILIKGVMTEAFPEIIEYFIQSREEYFLKELLKDLSKIHTSKIIPVFIKIFRNIELDNKVRIIVVEPLIKMKVEEIIPDFIEEVLSAENEQWFREEICRMLTKTTINNDIQNKMFWWLKNIAFPDIILKQLTWVLFFNAQYQKTPFHLEIKRYPFLMEDHNGQVTPPIIS